MPSFRTAAIRFEPLAALGDSVEEGDVAGYIHDPSRPLAPPFTVRFTSPGTVVGTRGPGPAARANVLVVNGAKQGPDLACGVFLEKGDAVIVTAPT